MSISIQNLGVGERLAGNRRVVERQPLLPHQLVGLVPLPRDQDGVAGPRGQDRLARQLRERRARYEAGAP